MGRRIAEPLGFDADSPDSRVEIFRKATRNALVSTVDGNYAYFLRMKQQ
jgi:hypothetical protein